MRMRSRRRFGRGRKRTVSWIDSITTYDGPGALSTRLVGLTNTGFGANVFGATIGVVVASDLPKHGGEDAVVTRVVGRLGFFEGRKNAGAGLAAYGFQMRVVLAQVATQGGSIFTDDFTTSAGMGNDKILFLKDVIVPNVGIGGAGAGYELTVGSHETWLEMDVKAKRRVTEDANIILWFQSVFPVGTTAADFRLAGGLRTLLMRPR